jgi:clan AA aspartic protease
MIFGQFSPKLEAIVRLFIADNTGQTQALDVIVDTGFSEFLSMPPAEVAKLGLTWLVRADTRLADGTSVPVDVYAGVVIWNGKSRSINVQALGVQNLIGVAMLAGHDVALRVTDGGKVSIDAIP